MSAIVDLSLASGPPPDLRCEVLIIGSGCGGATAARVLAEAGKDVIVLEEGGDRTGAALTQRDAQMYDQLYVERGGRVTEDGTISVLSGRVLGGGGVINASDVVPVHAATWALWRETYGLTQFTDAAVAPFVARALEDLEAKPILPEQVNRNNQILRHGTEKLGWRGEVMHHNRAAHCKGLATCLIGCPLDVKRNPRMVAIPKAQAAGARFFTRARAESIDGAHTAEKTVTVRTLDGRGYHLQHAFRVRAKVVIVAGNPVGTVHLLRKSGLGNRHLGKWLSLQPQIPMLAQFAENVDSFYGIPQSYAVTEFETYDPKRGFGGFRIEGIFGTPGIIGSLIPQSGTAGKDMMHDWRRAAGVLVLLPDESVGEIVEKHGRPLVKYTLTEEYKARARTAMQATAKIWLAAGAQTVVAPNGPPVLVKSAADLPKLAAMSLAPATLPLISAHQQGGARMAPTEATGVVDLNAQVYGTQGVYVFDSSWYPTTSSSHTMTPILTTSHFLSARLLAEWR